MDIVRNDRHVRRLASNDKLHIARQAKLKCSVPFPWYGHALSSSYLVYILSIRFFPPRRWHSSLLVIVRSELFSSPHHQLIFRLSSFPHCWLDWMLHRMA